MSNIFISHSSRDKAFVRKLAVALLSEGLPVWLDSWQMSAGDSLIDKVYEGIDKSGAVVLVISRSARESGWVDRELNAALSKEQSSGRKFLIPVKIEECDLPLKIADRIYVDFSQHGSFSRPASILCRQLANEGLADIDVAPEREMIGLSFSRGVHLDVASLTRTMQKIRKRHRKKIDVKSSKIVVNDEADYDALMNKLHDSIDTIAEREQFTPDLERGLRSALSAVQDLEADLREGTALLLNNTDDLDACYWFAKIVRCAILRTLCGYQLEHGPNPIQFGKEWLEISLISNLSAAKFFEVDNVRNTHLWNSQAGHSKHYSVWMDAEVVERGLCPDGPYDGPAQYFDAFTSLHAGKYVFPQMVHEHLSRRDLAPDPIWDLRQATIGLS